MKKFNLLFLIFVSSMVMFGQNCDVWIADSSHLGSAWLTALGSGKAPYTYTWSTGATTQQIYLDSSKADTYSVTLTDSVGCKSNASYTFDPCDGKYFMGPGYPLPSSEVLNDTSISYLSIAMGVFPPEPAFGKFVFTSFVWDFGDGTTTSANDSTFNGHHIYPTSGSYMWCLYGETDLGCKYTYCDTFLVEDPNTKNCDLVADFSYTVDSLNPLKLYFTDLSKDSLSSWNWDFGIGSISSLQYPSVIFQHTGVYIVELTVTNSLGCVEKSWQNVIVGNLTTNCDLVANFSFLQDSLDPLKVRFTDVSTMKVDSITTWSWNFGGGTTPNTSSLQNPVIVFNNSGTYNVTLIATSSVNCESIITKQVAVVDSTTTCIDPSKIDTMAPCPLIDDFVCGCNGVTYGNSCFADKDGVISYTKGECGSTSCIDPSKIDTTAGCLTVYDPVCGCNGLTYGNSCEADIKGVISYTKGECSSTSCSVSFTSYQDKSTFSNITFYSYPTGKAPFTYKWAFSDGTTSTIANPVKSPSNFSGWGWATLKVTDANGCEASYTDFVDVSTPKTTCSAAFKMTYDSYTGNAGEIFFTDASRPIKVITSWSWNFGDGTKALVGTQNPTHTFVSAGYYTICLTVTDGAGCTSTTCQSYYIDPSWWKNSPWNQNGSKCDANFIAVQDTTLSALVYVVDLSYGNNLHYTWNFGGTIVNTPYPFAKLTQFGAVDVCLTITDTVTGCSDSLCKTVKIDSLGNLLMKAANWGISVIPTPTPVSIATGIDAAEGNQHAVVSVYPNPSKSLLNISVSGIVSQAVAIEMIDIAGKIVKSTVSTNRLVQTLEINDLPEGIYFVKVSSENFSKVEKVVKIN